MGNLTRAAYANQRMTLDRNFAKESSKRNTMIALRGAIHSGVFSSFMFTQGVWRCLYQTWVLGNTPLLLSRKGRGGAGCVDYAGGGDDGIQGDGGGLFERHS